MRKQRLEAIEAEIRQEKAQALGRTGESLEQTLREIEAFRRELLELRFRCQDGVPQACSTTVTAISVRRAAHDRLCDHARQLRYCLIVQREAMGLCRHDDVDRHYPIPAPLAFPEGLRCEDGP